MTNKMNREIDKLHQEQESSRIALDAAKETFFEALKGQLGQDIMNELNTPKKTSKWDIIKNNLKKVLNI